MPDTSIPLSLPLAVQAWLEERNERWDRLFKILCERKISGYASVPIGLPSLDLALEGGIPRGYYTLLVAPPGRGKSALAVQMVSDHCRAGGSAIYLSIELPLEDAQVLFLSHYMGRSRMRIRRGELASECIKPLRDMRDKWDLDIVDEDDVRQELDRLRSAKEDTRQMDAIMSLISGAHISSEFAAGEWRDRKSGQVVAPPFIVIDYVQALLIGGGNDLRLEAVAFVRDIKRAAKYYGVAILAISSASRMGYETPPFSDETKVLGWAMSLASETSVLEAQAACVLALAYAKGDSVPGQSRRGLVVVPKTRFAGEPGVFGFAFDGVAGKFREISIDEVPGIARAVPDAQVESEILKCAHETGYIWNAKEICDALRLPTHRINGALNRLVSAGKIEPHGRRYRLKQTNGSQATTKTRRDDEWEDKDMAFGSGAALTDIKRIKKDAGPFYGVIVGDDVHGNVDPDVFPHVPLARDDGGKFQFAANWWVPDGGYHLLQGSWRLYKALAKALKGHVDTRGKQGDQESTLLGAEYDRREKNYRAWVERSLTPDETRRLKSETPYDLKSICRNWLDAGSKKTAFVDNDAPLTDEEIPFGNDDEG